MMSTKSTPIPSEVVNEVIDAFGIHPAGKATIRELVKIVNDIEEKLNSAYAGRKDYIIVGLDQWNGSTSAVQSFKNLTNVSFPLLLEASDVASSFKTTYDRLIVVDKNGKIAHKGARAASNDISTVETTVNDLLKNM